MASVNIFTTSPLPPIQGLFFTEKSVYADGHRQNPKLCLVVNMACLNPPLLRLFTHSVASRFVGLKSEAASAVFPCSVPSKVSSPK